VIAITAHDYLEPIPVAVNEPIQVYEPDENEERSNFAELLAGLMQSTVVEASDSETDLDFLALEKSKDGNKLNIFANAIEGGVDLESFSDIDLSDAVIEKEYQDILSAQHLLNSFGDDSGDLTQDADARTLKRLADFAAKMETAEPDSKAQVLAEAKAAADANAKKSIEEALANADKQGRTGKEQVNTDAANKNEKIDMLSAKDKAGEENASLNRRDENPGKLEELRNRSRRERAGFEIRDLRTASNAGAQGSTEMRPYALVETSAVRLPGHTPVQEITLELRLPDHGHSSQAQTSWEAKANTAMENMLARELHQNFNGDIVRHASMVLKNGGEGIIKLNLRPDSLGNVKIHLELTENKITGRIVVESEEALNAFRKEIASLEQAFKDSGFAEASLNLTLTADGTGAEQQNLEEGSFASQNVASNYEASFEQETAPIIDVFFGHKAGVINIFA